MNQYIEDTSYATSSLVATIFYEEEQLIELRDQQRLKQSNLQGLLDGIDFLELNPDLDDEGLGQLKIMEAADTNREIELIQEQIRLLSRSVNDKEFSATCLCAALLQIAKQGISIVHGGLTSCPDGRTIGTETLKNIIWQSRNQSMHYEEQQLHRAVTTCFANLEASFGAQFSLAHNTNLARHVIDVLEWSNHDSYTNDMILLLG